MADQKRANAKTAVNNPTGASKIDALYSWLSYDLQKLKKELLNEMKYSSAQIGSLYGEVKGDAEKNAKTVTQEIRYSYIQNQNIYDGLSESLSDAITRIDDVIARLNAFATDELAEGIKEKVADVLPPIQDTLNEIKYSYLQQQSIYEELKTLINENVITKIDEMNARFSLIEQMDVALEEMRQKIADFSELLESADHHTLVEQIVAAIPVAENVDYVRISDEVGDKMLEVLGDVLVQRPETETKEAVEVDAKIDYDRIVYGTAEKVVESLPWPDKVDYRRIEETFTAALEKAIVGLDIDALAEKVAAKIQPAATEIDYDKLSDMIVQKLGAVPVAAQPVEEPVVEEPVEEVVEEPVKEEIVVAKEPQYEEVGDDLIDAETGMVIRLKRSFTAKMSQSDDEVKGYYNDLKNALMNYKKIRSNVSWHGDRFNYGRETVAKMGINGKTLCFYLALDPKDEEQFKPTVYHQKDVSDQRAHESTPFMVKIKSGAAVKKAMRLIDALAQKLEAERTDVQEIFAYDKEFPYASTKKLLDNGHIKLTKEKKVEFNF